MKQKLLLRCAVVAIAILSTTTSVSDELEPFTANVIFSNQNLTMFIATSLSITEDTNIGADQHTKINAYWRE